ncbi:reverse transcriptase domain-containing protein [Tanacetum coccineum]
MLVEMADMTKKAPSGIAENILVGINKFLFPSDFVIIDKTPNETMIFGRPFLATIHAEINVFAKEISLGFDNDRCNTPKNGSQQNMFPGALLHNTIAQDDTYVEWCNTSPTPRTPSQETNNLRPNDYTFREWTLLKVGHTDIIEPVKKALLKLWQIDYFQDESGIIKEPIARNVHKDNTYWWHYHGLEEEERKEMGIEIEKYDPLEVQVETFEVKKYSFKSEQKFVCVTKEINNSLPLGRKNGLRFREMIRKEFDDGAHNKT